ncbi:recombinase family protein [Streptomyces sp. NPDC046862]|uniref:recombinase family protein n=1 Tax=Streptomyces sp. NPDC046862 TaxID=3154603 RepID=UPI003455CFC7
MSYARTSEDVRQRDGHGVRNQLRINERTAYGQGCEIVGTYEDNGRSASRAGVVRPDFDRLRGRPAVSTRGRPCPVLRRADQQTRTHLR